MEPEETPEVSAQPEAGMSQVAGPPGNEPVSEAAAKAVGPDTSEFEEEMPEDSEDTPLTEETRGERRVRVRTRTNWLMTAIVGLGMLVLGGMGGYVAHSALTAPTIERLAALERAATETAAQAATAAAQQPVQQPQPTPDMKAILAMLVSKTRHFKGDANAPVTILEFSDFQ